MKFNNNTTNREHQIVIAIWCFFCAQHRVHRVKYAYLVGCVGCSFFIDIFFFIMPKKSINFVLAIR